MSQLPSEAGHAGLILFVGFLFFGYFVLMFLVCIAVFLWNLVDIGSFKEAWQETWESNKNPCLYDGQMCGKNHPCTYCDRKPY